MCKICKIGPSENEPLKHLTKSITKVFTKGLPRAIRICTAVVSEAPAEIKALVVASVQLDNERQVSLTALQQQKKKLNRLRKGG